MIEPITHRSFVSLERQRSEIERLRTAPQKTIVCCERSLIVEPGVYDTGGDSTLLATAVKIAPDQTHLDVGCGTGIVSLVLAPHAAQSVGVDISEAAVANSQRNALHNGITNATFFQSDVFSAVRGTFDVITCNPPYGNHPVSDVTQRMFWDPNNQMKSDFFNQVNRYLAPRGRVYFGWADFADIDVHLPYRLADRSGLVLTHTYRAPHRSRDYSFWVLQFERAR